MRPLERVKDFRLGAPASLYAAAAACFVWIAVLPGRWALEAFSIRLPVDPVFLAATASVFVFVLLLKNPPRFVFLPSALIAVGAWGAGAFINILPQLSATFALIGAFGFVGFFPQWRRRWGASLFYVLLIALALPFAVSSQTGFGFFMRVAVTDAAAQILNLLGVTLLSAHDVLIFENSLARVDTPCSGLKSLFTGSAFFFAASGLLQRRMSLRWLMAYGAVLVFLVSGNVTRIVILVALLERFQAPALAELLHIPLGLIFFVLASAAGVLLLTKVEARAPQEGADASRQYSPMVGGLVSLCAAGAVLFLSPAQSVEACATPFIAAPAYGEYQSLPLTPAETRFYNSSPQTAAKKWRFATDELSGSILIVRSSALTAMHAPEICLEASRFQINEMTTHTVFPRETVREVSLSNPSMHAIYWMQSAATVTDSFTTRLKRYAVNGENDWVMVTVLFDNNIAFNSETTITYFNELKRHADTLLSAERGPASE